MQKPAFGVVTAVVTVLAVVAFLSRQLRGEIPAGPENKLASDPAEFMARASHQQIDWRPLTDAAFAEARRLDKPIMLVVGTANSYSGRLMDRVTFLAPEVRGFIARNFIAVRVDSAAMPEYANAFLPISRAMPIKGGYLGIPADLQIWFLDPKGYIFGNASYIRASEPLDPKIFMAALIDAANRYEEIATASAEPGEIQRRDLGLVEQKSPQELPDLTKYAVSLAAMTPTNVGGFPNQGFQRLWPLAWQFQLKLNQFGDYQRSIFPCLTSPLFDLLDGGFFQCARTVDWRAIEYDKSSIENAAMLRTLALGALLMKDERQKWFALRTFDCLTDRFPRDGLIAAGQVGDEGTLDRSARCGFSPRRLRELLPDLDDRTWAWNNLGLRVETNPQMSPMLTSLDLPEKDPETFGRTMSMLKKGLQDPDLAGLACIDVGGYCTARMLEVARWLEDAERLKRAETLFERLDEFRTRDDVVHSLVPGIRSHAYLGDYLAFADGALQYFLATGNVEVFENGLAVLKRGLFLFATKYPGVFTLSQPPGSLAPQDSASPEIVDNRGESCTAKIIRLCSDYGRLLGPAGQKLRTTASETLTRFAAIAPLLGPYAGGYCSAAVDMVDPVFAVAVGTDAVTDASKLAAKVPGRLVAPAAGPVYFPGKRPGLYVVRDRGVLGPISEARAIRELSPAASRP